MNLSTYVDKSYSGSRINPTSSTEQTYEVSMVYNKNSGGQPFVLTCTGSNCVTGANSNIHKKYIPLNLTDATITIGGNGLNNTSDVNSMKILELHICKGTFGTNYSCKIIDLLIFLLYFSCLNIEIAKNIMYNYL